jgi:hypothetical protein
VKKSKKFTQSKAAKIAALLEKGVAAKSIAKRVGCSVVYVYKVKKDEQGRKPADKVEAALEEVIEEISKPDMINHPDHYTTGGIETIDFIEAKGLGYNLGNAVKYISRAEYKGNVLEDLKKARFYLDREIEIWERLPGEEIWENVSFERALAKADNKL